MNLVIVFTLIGMIPFNNMDSMMETKQNITFYLAGVLLEFLLFFLYNGILKKIIFKSKKIKPVLFYFIIAISFVMGVILSVKVSELYEIEVSNKIIVLISVGYIAIYLLIRSIFRYIKYGNIRKESKEDIKQKKEEMQQIKSFNKEMNEDSTYKIMVDGMAK